jgi:UDP-GlcNAc3NAcA epimerase
MRKLLTIVGARPQFIKAAAVSRAIRLHFSTQIEEIILHTGQHYDPNMSASFFDELEIPKPKVFLESGSGLHGQQVALMLEGIERAILQFKPDMVLVYGDTNSTLAGALAASKLHIPLAHVEAGLRSFNKAMPEEINRITTDHCSTLLFCANDEAVKNLKREGFSMANNDKASIDNPHIFHAGDVMLDNARYFQNVAKDINIPGMGQNESFILCTAHRDSNTDNSSRLLNIIQALISIAEKTKLVIPLHPRTAKAIENLSDKTWPSKFKNNRNIILIEPVSYLEMCSLLANCKMVITDSGGLQKEAYYYHKPCIVLRKQTEWVELTHRGYAILTDDNVTLINEAVKKFLHNSVHFVDDLYGDGRAAELICEKITEYFTAC